MFAGVTVGAVTDSGLCGDGSQLGHLLSYRNISRSGGMRANRRKRIATAKQYAQRHFLRRSREAAHGLSTDLNAAYELIFATGVEKQGKQSRLQMIPGEALVVEQQPFGDILGRVGGVSGFGPTPTASNEVNSIRRSFPAPMFAAGVSCLLMWVDCVTSSTGLHWPPGAGSKPVEPRLVDISRSRVVIRHAFVTKVEACWRVQVLVRPLVGNHATTRD